MGGVHVAMQGAILRLCMRKATMVVLTPLGAYICANLGVAGKCGSGEEGAKAHGKRPMPAVDVTVSGRGPASGAMQCEFG